MRLRPTRFGLQSAAFYLAMLAAHYASPYTNLSFLLLSFLTLTGVLGSWWTVRNLRGVSAVVGELEPLPAGSAGLARAHVRSSGGTRFDVHVTLELEGGQVLTGRVPVLAGEAVVELAVPPLPRGIHRILRASAWSGYPLGLFRWRRPASAPADLAVYPAPRAGTAARTGAQVLAEALGAGGQADGELQPAGLRDYVEGDDLRRIHWRATARRGQPVLREWEGSGGGGLELLIDRRAPKDELEAALGIASAVVRLAREQKELLALTSQGLQETYGDGHRPWAAALRFLAGAQALAANGPAPPPVSRTVARLPAGRRAQELGRG